VAICLPGILGVVPVAAQRQQVAVGVVEDQGFVVIEQIAGREVAGEGPAEEGYGRARARGRERARSDYRARDSACTAIGGE